MHTPVLLHEVIAGLAPKPEDIFLDCTVNGGGHSEAMCRETEGKVTIIGIDLDTDALSRTRERLSACGCRFTLVEENFRNLDKALKIAGAEKVDEMLFDLGWSSDQLEQSGRGFSFQKDEPLSMTFKKNPTESDLTAFDILNNWDEENICSILESYGEERFSRKISKRIVETRKIKPIKTTSELVEIIKKATPRSYQKGKIHPATKVFQALRITVNDEIGSLKEGLEKGVKHLKPEGKMAVISFHRLEDRVVKNFFKETAAKGEAVIITKKPVVPSRDEIRANHRSRSAKMRLLQKLS